MMTMRCVAIEKKGCLPPQPTKTFGISFVSVAETDKNVFVPGFWEVKKKKELFFQLSIKLSFLVVLFPFYNYLFPARGFLKLSEICCNPLKVSLCKMQYEKLSIF